jgi:hypothetical protein
MTAPNPSASLSAAEMMFHPFLPPQTSSTASSLFSASSSSSSLPDEPRPKRGKLDPAGKRAQRKSGRDSGKPNPLISPTEKCKVCLEPAAKHIHYGAVTCFSCRAFFRRSIQNRSSDNYKCRCPFVKLHLGLHKSFRTKIG